MDTLVPEIDIELDRPRHIVFDMNAICLFEQVTGKNFYEVIASPPQSATDRRALLWAGLKRDDPELTIEQVGAWSPMVMAEVDRKLVEAVIKGSPEPEEGAEPEGKNTQSSTG